MLRSRIYVKSVVTTIVLFKCIRLLMNDLFCEVHFTKPHTVLLSTCFPYSVEIFVKGKTATEVIKTTHLPHNLSFDRITSYRLQRVAFTYIACYSRQAASFLACCIVFASKLVRQ